MRAARKKLLQWEITEKQIDDILATRTIREHLTILSPVRGTVVEKLVVEKSAVKAGDVLYRLADLTNVWASLDVYEYELGLVQYGQRVEIRAEAYPGEAFTGRLTFISPVLDEATRTVKARVNIDNPHQRLKPGMFVHASIHVPLLGNGKPAPTGVEGQYACPMHPEIIQHDPGTCPICGMDLRRIPGDFASAGESADELLAVPVAAVLDSGTRTMAAPLLILFLGLTVWQGIRVTLYPVEWLVNRFAYEPLSPELRAAMYLQPHDQRQRPLLELTELRWQRQDPREAAAERDASLAVLREGRILPGLGREFMPPLDEGSLLYMPSLLPHAALSQAVAINRKQDLAIATVPEVASVVGKLGRAETALDPAPIGMFETIIILKPVEEGRLLPVQRWFAAWPGWLKAPLAWLWPEERRITKGEILQEMQAKVAIPGVLPTWLQPTQTRLVMLQTGFRAMMGVKIYGAHLQEIERIGLHMEQILKTVPGATDVVADRIIGKPYIEFAIDRERIARYGVTIRDVQDVIETALGGMNLLESVEGRERYPIRLRYVRDLREDLPDIQKILVLMATGGHVPLAQVADIRMVVGPQEIKGEGGLLVGYVTMNTRDRDEVSVVEDAEAALQAAVRDGRLRLPPGY